MTTVIRQYNRTVFNERLISEVEKRIPLWDIKHPDYKDSKLLTVLWEEIAIVMDLSVKDVMERWRNLRDTFVRHLRKIKEAKRVGSDQTTSIRWPYFKQLLFLRPSVNHRTKSRMPKYVNEMPIPECEPNIKIERQSLDEECNSFQDYSLDFTHTQLQLQIDDDASQYSIPRSSSSSNSSSLSVFECADENSRKTRKRHMSRVSSDEFIKNLQTRSKRETRKHDDVDMFVLSLAPHLRKVPPHLYGLCQMNLLQIAVSFSAGIIPNKLCNPFSN